MTSSIHMTTREILDSRGYIVIRGALKDAEIEAGISCFVGQQMDYAAMIRFIEFIFMPKIADHMYWKPNWTKYRASDSDNASDASTFHRDLVPLKDDGSHSHIPLHDVYTALCYFDSTHMDVKPKSHLKRYTYLDSFKEFKDCERLSLAPGDILLFHPTLLHRGIFTEGLAHRRLLQIFEIYPDSSAAAFLSPSILHIPYRGETVKNRWKTGLTNWMSHLSPTVAFMNMCATLNAAYGYNIEEFADHELLKDILYLSSEGLQSRIRMKRGQLQPINRYVFSPRMIIEDLYNIDPELNRKAVWAMWTKPFVDMGAWLILGFAAVTVSGYAITLCL